MASLLLLPPPSLSPSLPNVFPMVFLLPYFADSYTALTEGEGDISGEKGTEGAVGTCEAGEA